MCHVEDGPIRTSVLVRSHGCICIDGGRVYVRQRCFKHHPNHHCDRCICRLDTGIFGACGCHCFVHSPSQACITAATEREIRVALMLIHGNLTFPLCFFVSLIFRFCLITKIINPPRETRCWARRLLFGVAPFDGFVLLLQF